MCSFSVFVAAEGFPPSSSTGCFNGANVGGGITYTSALFPNPVLNGGSLTATVPVTLTGNLQAFVFTVGSGAGPILWAVNLQGVGFATLNEVGLRTRGNTEY